MHAIEAFLLSAGPLLLLGWREHQHHKLVRDLIDRMLSQVGLERLYDSRSTSAAENKIAGVAEAPPRKLTFPVS